MIDPVEESPVSAGREPTVSFLAHVIVDKLDEHTAEWLKPHGLKVKSARILMRLDAVGSMRIGELADATSIEVSALSHILTRLAEQDFVVRSRIGVLAGQDSRTVTVTLTDSGKALMAKLGPQYRDYDERTTRGFSAAERSALKRALARVVSNLADDRNAR